MLNFPPSITAGDKVEFFSSLSNYSSTDYALSFAIAGSVLIPSTTIADGIGWKTTIAAAATENVTPGYFAWSATLTKSGDRVTDASGRVTLLANLANLSTYDPRSQNEKTLAAIKDAIAKVVASGGVTQVSFEGRSQTVDLTQLIALENRYQNLVNQEIKDRSLAAGRGDPSKSRVRFR